MLDESSRRISLAIDNVEYIKQDGELLETNTDETLWFNKEKDTGEYKFEVKTKEGVIYIAILDWIKKEEDEEEELEGKTVEELKGIAKEEGIKGYSSMTKQQLIDAINETP